MKRQNIILLIAALMLMFFVLGCEKDGTLKVHNQTSYPVYAGLLGFVYPIPADSVLKLHITTQRQTPFTQRVSRRVNLALQGETYQIWDELESTFVESTFVRIDAGGTTSVYLHPNRACIKVLNRSQWNIKKIIIQRNAGSTPFTAPYDVFITPGNSWYKQVMPATTQNSFYYLVQVQFENDTIISYGDSGNILYTDDRFLVMVEQQ